MFLAPPEVHQSILDLRAKTTPSRIGKLNSYDVIVWLLEQTCIGVEQLQPLYISQGSDFCRRTVVTRENHDASRDAEQRAALLKVLEQKEQYSLEELYFPKRATKKSAIKSGAHDDIAAFVRILDSIKADMSDTTDTVQALAHSEVEQEREIHVEVELIQQRKKPPRATAAATPPLHRDVRQFAETGRSAWGSQAFQQAFSALQQTSIWRKYGINDSAMSSKLYVTSDFTRTVATHLP